jgi:hypothetical protein
MKLEEILGAYGVPDPKIVGKLPKAGTSLDFVGHADITRILLTVDPTWRWVPIAWDNGRPAIHIENGIATMWGELTILGQARLGVGSVRADKQELDKELVGDFLRNAAMRFGICLSLWTKQEWDDVSHTITKPMPKAATSAPQAQPVAANTDSLVSTENIERFKGACSDIALDWREVANSAGVNLDTLRESDMKALRAAFTAAKEALYAPKPALPPEVMDDFNPAYSSTEEALATVVDLFVGAEVIEPSRSNHPANGTPQIKEPNASATPPQLGKLRALCSGAGINSKEDQLSMASDHTKRTITSFNDLTKKEASELISILAP